MIISTRIFLIALSFILFSNPAIASEAITQNSAKKTNDSSASITAQITSNSKTQTLQVSNDELYDLQKLKIQRELEEAITKWAQTKFWFIAIVALIAGYFGIRSFVRELVAADLKDAMKASAEAQAAASLAKDSIKEVRAEATKYKDHVESATETANDVNIKLVELRTRIEAEGDRSVALSDVKIQALEKQIEELKKEIWNIAGKSAPDLERMQEVNSRLSQARQEATSKQQEFIENSKIKLTVVAFKTDPTSEQADTLMSALANNGYRPGLTRWGMSPPKKHKQIRVTHRPELLNQAQEISSIIATALSNQLKDVDIKVIQKEKPISNKNDEIVIFFD